MAQSYFFFSSRRRHTRFKCDEFRRVLFRSNATDLVDLKQRITPAEVHVIQRLVAFFATGDSIVSNNLVLNLYKHINSPRSEERRVGKECRSRWSPYH